MNMYAYTNKALTNIYELEHFYYPPLYICSAEYKALQYNREFIGTCFSKFKLDSKTHR